MNFNIAICDDEKIFCETLQRLILKQRPCYCIDIYYAGNDLLSAKKDYDMIFMDIGMPDGDGMCTARELRSLDYTGHIIFLTSHMEYIQDAFKVKAFRFLQKPIDFNVLGETLEEFEKEIMEVHRLIVSDYGSEFLISVADILFIETESMRNGTKIHLKNRCVQTSHTLKYWVRELEGLDFFQIHKSYVVSLRHIKKIDDNKVMMYGCDLQLPVSRRNFSAFRKVLFHYVSVHAKTI